MNPRKYLFAAFIACVSFLLLATAATAQAEPKWITVVTSESGDRYDIDAMSSEYVMDKATGKPDMLIFMGRKWTKGPIAFYHYGVMLEACAQGYGKLIIKPLNEAVTSVSYVAKGGSVGSEIGDQICEFHRAVMKRAAEGGANFIPTPTPTTNPRSGAIT